MRIDKRTRGFGVVHGFSEQEWNSLLEETEGVCPACKKSVGIDKLTLDHKLPVSRAPEGFVYHLHDVMPLCRMCNIRKGNTVPKEYTEVAVKRGKMLAATRLSLKADLKLYEYQQMKNLKTRQEALNSLLEIVDMKHIMKVKK